MPESRSLLPDNHNEVFGVNTSSFVMTNEDIKKEKVLGSSFEREIKQGRNFFQGNLAVEKDPRIRAMNELIDDIENDTGSNHD